VKQAVKDIRTKERDNRPKVLEKEARMPKELVREAKEKSAQAAGNPRTGEGQESEREYAGRKAESGIRRITGDAGRGTVKISYAAGRFTAQKVFENLQEKKSREQLKKKAAEKAKKKRSDIKTREYAAKKSGRQGASRHPDKLSVKRSPRLIKTTVHTAGKSKELPASVKKQVQAANAAKRKAVRDMKRSEEMRKRMAELAVRFKKAVEAAAKTTGNGFVAIAAGAAAMFTVLILIIGVIGGVFSYSSSGSSQSVSEQVLAYTETIQKYATEYGIPDYVAVIQAIMMQESGGSGTDPMQASECTYNTKYPNSPGAILDPEYSIQVGVRYYADCVAEAGCTSPADMDKLKLSLQGYNYGNGYISWAVSNYGGYSEANALLFSQQQAASHGWTGYGDPEYVSHVLRYYSGGNPFGSLFGNEQIVSVALSQLGNAGGKKFWSWYGFDNRVSWCACFASWCADQSGLIDSGAVPKFSDCDEGIAWFKKKGKWQAAGSTPAAGSLIFFDWNGDGDSDHVGIVEKCEGGRVYTVEGNSGDAVRQRDYAVDYSKIMGYGVVA
jgi:hypothetical protein